MKKFKNPIAVDVVKAIRDPFIILENNTYYLTGTVYYSDIATIDVQ